MSCVLSTVLCVTANDKFGTSRDEFLLSINLRLGFPQHNYLFKQMPVVLTAHFMYQARNVQKTVMR